MPWAPCMKLKGILLHLEYISLHMPIVIALGQAWQSEFYKAIHSAYPLANGSVS